MKNSGLLKALLAIPVLIFMQACNLPQVTPNPSAGSSTAIVATLPVTSGGDACNNPLYPVVKGASWNYSLTGVATDTFTHSITDVRADGFTDQDLSSTGGMRTGQWKCDHGALIALSPITGPASAITTNDMTATFQVSDMSGVTLPASVKTGDTWTQEFTVEGTQSVSGQIVAAKGKVTFDCTAGATESVTVAAGSFDAQRVDCKINLNVAVDMGGIQIPTSFSGDTSMWYAQGAGLVKLDGTIGGLGGGTIELTGYSIP